MDLTKVYIGRTKVIYKGVVCVFSTISSVWNWDSGKNHVRSYTVCLVDYESYQDPKSDIKINTGNTLWYHIEPDCERYPDSLNFIEED